MFNSLKKTYYEFKLYDIKMNIVSQYSDYSNVHDFLKPRSIVAQSICIFPTNGSSAEPVTMDYILWKEADPASKFFKKNIFPSLTEI